MKPGWKTTEFWIAALTSSGAIAASTAGFVQPKHAALVLAISSGCYSVSRGLAKKSPDITQITASAPPVNVNVSQPLPAP